MRKAKNSGQSLVEVLVAIAVFVIAMTAGFSLFFGGQAISVDSSNVVIATDYAKEGLDALRAIRNRNFTELTIGTHGLTFNGNEWLLSSSTSDAKDIFTRQIAIAKIGDTDNIKIATTTITWQGNDPNVTKSIYFVEHFSNWETPLQSSCKTQPLSGNWAAPITVGSADIGPGNQGTDVVAKGPYAYMSGVAASASKPDIFIFDVSTPSAPTQISSLNVTTGGIETIFLNGNYIYGASADNSMEFLVIDVSDPMNPSLAASLDLTGNSDALSVAVIGDTAIVGRDSASANGLVFIDISTPTSPRIVSQFTVPNSGNVTDLAYTDTVLFATDKSSAATDILMYDITDLNNPVSLGTYDVPNTTLVQGVYIEIKGGHTNLLVGDGGGGYLSAIGASTTAQMYLRSQASVGGPVNDIVCVLGNLAFIATSNGGAEFTILNVNDLNNVTVYASLNYPQIATGIDFDNNYVFMAVRSNDALRIITSQ